MANRCRAGAVAIAAVAALGVAGCTTIVEVERYTGSEAGFRYSLPATYLLVTPKPDGTAAYDWVSLPDPANEYVVRTTAYLAKYTMDLSFANGMLTKATSKLDSTDIPAKAIQTAQTIYSARVAASADAARKEADRSATLAKAVADAEVDLSQAKAELAVLEANVANGARASDVIAARVRVARAQARLEAALAALASPLRSTSAQLEGAGPGQAWGPVLFKVVQTADDVELVAVTPQQGFDTTTAVKPPKPPK
jgi:hypothetical protein